MVGHTGITYPPRLEIMLNCTPVSLSFDEEKHAHLLSSVGNKSRTFSLQGNLFFFHVCIYGH